MTLKNELPRSVGAPYATGEITPERMKKQPKRKQRPVVDVTGDGSEVRCYKEQYCIGTWNVRSLNQGKLKVGKQVMARILEWVAISSSRISSQPKDQTHIS